MDNHFVIATVIFSFVLTLFTGVPAAAQDLTISYPERPPYYFTNTSGQADGTLLRLTRRIMEEAGLEARYISLSVAQILYVVEHSSKAHCSIGWFRTSERASFARFSLPVHLTERMTLLARRDHRDIFSQHRSLEQVFRDKNLVFGRNMNYSYGEYVDELFRELAPTTFTSAGTQSLLLKAVSLGQADYMLIAPEEAVSLVRASGFSEDQFVRYPLSDLTARNQRRLMCSRGVSEALLERIDGAIEGMDLLEPSTGKN